MMVCQVCPHEKRREIDKALVLGQTERSIAQQFSVHHSSIHRHRDCIADSMERAGLKSSLTAKSVMLDLVDDLRQMAAQCNSEKRELMFLAVADRLTRACDSFGKLNREVESPSVQTFLVALGVSNENELRDALDMRRSMSSANVGEFKQELLAGMRFLLAEDSEFRSEALAVLETGSRAEVVPGEVAGNGGGNGHRE